MSLWCFKSHNQVVFRWPFLDTFDGGVCTVWNHTSQIRRVWFMDTNHTSTLFVWLFGTRNSHVWLFLPNSQEPFRRPFLDILGGVSCDVVSRTSQLTTSCLVHYRQPHIHTTPLRNGVVFVSKTPNEEREKNLFYCESRKWEVKTRLIYESRCDERLKN